MIYTHDLPEGMDAKAALTEAMELASGHGGKIDGDSTKGSFTGKGVNGVYTVTGRTVKVLFSKLPPFITEKMITEQLNKYLAEKFKN
jgi:hypothetical protein